MSWGRSKEGKWHRLSRQVGGVWVGCCLRRLPALVEVAPRPRPVDGICEPCQDAPEPEAVSLSSLPRAIQPC